MISLNRSGGGDAMSGFLSFHTLMNKDSRVGSPSGSVVVVVVEVVVVILLSSTTLFFVVVDGRSSLLTVKISTPFVLRIPTALDSISVSGMHGGPMTRMRSLHDLGKSFFVD